MDTTSYFYDAVRAMGLEASELIVPGKFYRAIAGDDRLKAGHPGATKIKAVVIAIGTLLALPQWSDNAPKMLTDFNELVTWLGEVKHD